MAGDEQIINWAIKDAYILYFHSPTTPALHRWKIGRLPMFMLSKPSNDTNS